MDSAEKSSGDTLLYEYLIEMILDWVDLIAK